MPISIASRFSEFDIVALTLPRAAVALAEEQRERSEYSHPNKCPNHDNSTNRKSPLGDLEAGRKNFSLLTSHLSPLTSHLLLLTNVATLILSLPVAGSDSKVTL